MSDDEAWLSYASGFIALLALVFWYRRILAGRDSSRAAPERWVLGLAPLAPLGVIFLVLRVWASADVRDAPQYIFMYMAMGVPWLGFAVAGLEWLGISFRDDALGERNFAAALVVAATMLGHGAIYAGANIGNGPGWWTVVIAAGIGSAAWFTLWFAVEWLCGTAEDVTVDRDVPAGLRLGGYAIGMGILLGRGAAGDWTSLTQTVIEFAAAWPVLPLTLIVIAAEKILERQPLHVQRHFGLSAFLGGFYAGIGIAALGVVGALPHNPAFDFLNWMHS